MIIFGVAISVVVVLALGLAVSRRVQGSSTNFLVAGRALPLPFAGATLMGQAVDTNATLGNTDLSYTFGFWAGASLPLGLALCLFLTGVFFAKPMNRMGLTTLPDYYRLRFGRSTEVASSVLMIAAFAILVAGNLVAGGLLFEYFLGTSYEVGVLIIVGCALLYTVTGGIIADAYISVVQMGIALVGSVALLIWMAAAHGLFVPDGMGPFDLAQLTDSAYGAPINWATLIALGIGDIVAIDFMQRVFCAGSPQIAQRACFIGAAGAVIIGVPYSLVALSATQLMPDQGGVGVLLTLLDDFAPAALTILVLSGIVAASMSTADGAIAGTAAVTVRNIAGVRRTHSAGTADPLLKATRIAMAPVVILAVWLAIEVPQTGVLLLLAFDLMLACLIAPFMFGLFTRFGTGAAAVAAIVVGLVVRLGLFAVTPTMYGLPNDVWFIENDTVQPLFDGWPTFIALAASVIAYVVVGAATPRHHERGVDIRADVEEPEPDLLTVEHAAPVPTTEIAG